MRIKSFPHRQSWLSISLLAVMLALCAASRAGAGIADAVKYTKLANGLQVIVLENHKSPVATFNVFYHVGSRNERFGKTGISHLCEHLMFRGTKKLAPEEFSNIIQESGGEDNAFTSSDFTDYFEIINRDHLDVPISLEADRMANFAPKGFDSEKAVVMEERRLRADDNPGDALQEMTQAAAFVAHPYHWPVIGWMHEIEGITLQDALDYHAIYYSPQNAIIVAVGDFDGDQVIKRVTEAFGAIKNSAKPPPPVSEIEPPQEGERRVVMRHAANLPALNEAYHAPNYRDLADAFALEVASEILSDGKSSRLYKDLVVDKQSVVDVGAEYDMNSFDPDLFWVSAQVRPGVKTEDVIAEIDKQIAALRNAPVTPEELQRAKNLEQSGFVYGQDSIFREAELLGVFQMLGDYHRIDDYLTQIEKITAADVQRVAKKYLVDGNRTVGVLVPTGVLRHEMAGGGASGPVRHIDGLGVNDPSPLTAPPRIRPVRSDQRGHGVMTPARYLEAAEVIR
jgi:zinc protease